MKINKESGFGVIEILLITVIVGLIGFMGWYVWHSKHDISTPAGNTVSSFAGTIKVANCNYSGCPSYSLQTPTADFVLEGTTAVSPSDNGKKAKALGVAQALEAGAHILHVKSIQIDQSAQTTLTGMVSEGPTSPTATPGIANSAAVANHSVEAIDTQGKVANSTKTDIKGVYTLALNPGQYTIKLMPPIGQGDKTYPVTVGSGTTTFNISADTGIQ